MSLIKCRECKNKISRRAKFCPHCGYTKGNPGIKMMKYGLKLAILVPVIVIILLAVVGSM